MKNLIRQSLNLLFITTLACGVFYPLAVTGIAQLVFPKQAQGSLIKRGNEFIGSELIGQNFSAAVYFWSRPSATLPMPYNAANSGGSNLGPTNPALVDRVKARIATLRATHPEQPSPVPSDLVTTSASGIDPHISPTAAFYQVQRVATARGIDAKIIQSIVERAIEPAQWGLFGDARVNVLRLNLALDDLHR